MNAAYELVPRENKGKPNKIVIYTAIFGNYDELLDPVFINEDCDYICFTNNRHIKSKHWKIIVVKELTFDNTRQARWVKVLPHLFFQNYKYSVWVDGNIQIIGNMKQLIRKHLVDSSIALFKHPIRKCIYLEARACIRLKKDTKDVIRKQISRYKLSGYPKNNGLIESGVLIRRHNEPPVVQTMEEWWNEIASYSKRDQLSFNFVAWKNKTGFTIIDANIRDNEYFKWRKHDGKQRYP